MATTARRRGYGEDSIYFDAANNCWTAAISLGYSPDGKRRIRRKVTGKTKTAVKDKLKALRRELEAGIQSSPSYTMALCIEDWLSQGLAGRSASTVTNYRFAAEHVVSKLGVVKLRELTARHVQTALDELSGSLSTRSLRLVHQVMERSIRHAQAADLVGRNVASLVSAPEGKGGRPSRSLTLDQAVAVLKAAESSPLHAYVVLSLVAGLRTEELRSLLWSEVDLDARTVAVFRSVRASGETKTPKSRRVLRLPVKAVDALKEHRAQQVAARITVGPLWQDYGLVFASAVGTPLDAHNVRRSFRTITKQAGLGQRVRWWYQCDRAWWRRRQSSQCPALPGGGGCPSRRPVSGTVSGIIPGPAGGGWPGRTGAGAAVLVRRRSRAVVTAQMARAAMTSMVCRAIAV